MTVVLDDRLLRDWIANRDDTVVSAISAEQEATTNLCYARLCESAARADRGAILEGWAPNERRAVIAGLVAPADDVMVVPDEAACVAMRELSNDHRGVSTLGAEAVAAAIEAHGRLLVSVAMTAPAHGRAARASASATTPSRADRHRTAGRTSSRGCEERLRAVGAQSTRCSW